MSLAVPIPAPRRLPVTGNSRFRCSVWSEHGVPRAALRPISTHDPRNAPLRRRPVVPGGPGGCPKRAPVRGQPDGNQRWVRRRAPLLPPRASPTARRLPSGHLPGMSRDTPPVAGGVPAPNQAEWPASVARRRQRLARPGRIGWSISSVLSLVMVSAAGTAHPRPPEASRPHGTPDLARHGSPSWRCNHPAPTARGGRWSSGCGPPRTPAEELCATATPTSLRYPTSHGAHPIRG